MGRGRARRVPHPCGWGGRRKLQRLGIHRCWLALDAVCHLHLADVAVADGLTVDGGVTVTTGGLTVSADGVNVTGNTVLNNNLNVNGNTRLGNAGSDTVGFYTTNGTAQQTTGVASATVVNGSASDPITSTTFDGYTVAQVVRAVRNVGLLA